MKKVKIKDGYLFGFEIAGGIALVGTGLIYFILLLPFTLKGDCGGILLGVGLPAILISIPIIIWSIGLIKHLLSTHKERSEK